MYDGAIDQLITGNRHRGFLTGGVSLVDSFEVGKGFGLRVAMLLNLIEWMLKLVAYDLESICASPGICPVLCHAHEVSAFSSLM